MDAIVGVGVTAALTLGLLAAPRARAQGRVFEVASVKPNKSGDTSNGIDVQPGGRFTATNVTLEALIRAAYQVPIFRLSGGPAWMRVDRFDIAAKAQGPEGNVAPAAPGTIGPINLMLQSLLTERFKLVVHHEMRDLPVYALVLARTDGTLGAQLQQSKVDCQAIMSAALRGGSPPPPPQANGRPVCGLRTNSGRIVGGGALLSQLAAALGGLGRPVLDRTGLQGGFDFELTFALDQPQPGANASPIDATLPSIFTALQEQLGLKLESQQAPVDILVVDGAERPTEN